MFKCLPVELGFDILLNPSYVLPFRNSSYTITDLGGGNVRFTRLITSSNDIVSTKVTDFVDMNGQVIANTVDELRTYLTSRGSLFDSGEGIAIDGRSIKVVSGGPETFGGYKVGTGLNVDGTGKLSANATSEATKILATEADMLALTTDALRPYRVIRLDTKRLYYLNPNESPSVLSNWFVGPSIEAAVVSFNNKTGVVVPEFADYNADLVPLIDKTTSVNYTLVIDDGLLYLVDPEQQRTPVASSTSLTDLTIKVNSIDDFINNQVDGLNLRVVNLSTKVDQIDNAVNSATTGLIKRTNSLESSLVTKADLVSGKVPMSQLPDISAGRKVNVANRAARLQLSAYNDLTIAYESDTASAYALNANDNPAIDSNWSLLGNAQASGVTSFNSRTGPVTPLSGDYLTDQITETLTKRFVSNDDYSKFQAYESLITTLQSNLTATQGLLATAQTQLTTLTQPRVWRSVRSTRVNGTWYTNNTGRDIEISLKTGSNAIYNRVEAHVRENASATAIVFQGNTSDTGSFVSTVYITCPPGWQYRGQVSGNQARVIEDWRELSV